MSATLVRTENLGVQVGLAVLCTVFLVTVVLIALVRWVLGLFRMARVAASIPGPTPWALIGNFLDVSRDQRHIMTSLKGLVKQYGPLLRLWLGPYLAVFVFDARDAEVVLTECPDKPPIVYKLLTPVLGDGLLVINGREHRRHRKLILPSLHRGVLETFHPFMRLSGGELMRAMAAHGDQVFDVTPLCGDAAMDSSYRTLLNADDDLFIKSQPQRRYAVRQVTRMSTLLMKRFMHPWHHPDWLFRLLSSYYAEYTKNAAVYDRLILDVLEHKLARMKEQDLSSSEEEPAFPRKRLAFLDSVLSSEGGRALSKDELFNELKTMVAGGVVTSMDSMSVMFLLLSLLPDHQAKIQQELDDIFAGDPGRTMELSDLDHMDYLERFIKESMRMYPPFPVIARYVNKDLKLPSGHTLPAGCYVAMSALGTHWNPTYFPKPTRFDPDRFLPEACRDRHPCANMTFSYGSRNCIGGRYAMMFLKTCIASVLRHLNVLPDPEGPQQLKDIKMVMGVTYYPERGSRVRVEPRRQPC